MLSVRLPFFTGAAFVAINAIGQYAPPDPSGLEGIIVETYYVSDSADAADTDGTGSADLSPSETTYRVFVDLKEDYELLTVGGFVNHDLSFTTTTSFFTNDDRGEAWAADINDIHLDLNTVAIDSWLSMGAGSDDHWAIPKAEDPDTSIVGGDNSDGGSNSVPGGLLVNFIPAMGIALPDEDGLVNTGTSPPAVTSVGTAPTIFNTVGGSTFTSQDFAWAVLGGIATPFPSNKILIGQFTTDGTFSFCLNLWVKIPDSLVCADPNCHDILEFYGTLLPSDTAGGGFATDNRFTHSTLCFTSSAVDCLGVPGGPALPGTSCDDGNPYTTNDVYAPNCDCLGEDCYGVLGGPALPGYPCDDGNPNTSNDTLDVFCDCAGIPVGIEEAGEGSVFAEAHPNPTNGLLWMTIIGITGEQAGYALTDATGRVVAAGSMGTITGSWTGSLDMTDMGTGVYFLEFSVGTRRSVEQVIKY